MPYGTVKVDNVTFTNNSVDATTTFSGIYASITNNLTLSGTATAATFTGTTANFTNVNAQNISVTTSLSGLAITGGTAGFTTITGTTVTGTTANFVTVSGTTVTGTTASFTSGIFTSLSGTTHTITSGVFALGTAALPSISFVSDPNTGIYSPGADQVAVATNGVQRISIDTNGLGSVGGPTGDARIEIGAGATGNRTAYLDFVTDTTYSDAGLRILRGSTGADSDAEIRHRGTGALSIVSQDAGTLRFLTTNTERARIDSSGRLLVGTSTARANLYNSTATAQHQSEIANSSAIEYLGIRNSTDLFGGTIALVKSRGTTVGSNTIVQSGDQCGIVSFQGSDGTEFVESAKIECQVDGTPGANDMPGRLVFSTTADGAAVPTERLRIDSAGFVSLGGDTNTGFSNPSADNLAITTGGTERARIDSNGKLLVGTSSAYTVEAFTRHVYFCPLAGEENTQVVVSAAGAAGFPGIYCTKTRGASPTAQTIVQNGDVLGVIRFFGSDGVDYDNSAASIDCYVDGTPGANDMPGRLVFSTTADGASSPTEQMRISANGNVNVVGALSKGSGSFRIDHPLSEKKDTHHLIHSFIEGPQADLIYRGHVNLINGKAIINIDEAARMTEGTFNALCTNVCCFTSNESDWTAVRGSVSDNILTIEAQNPTSTAEVCWMVIGERKDQHMLDTNWTDENGRVITEPLKEVTSLVTQ